MKAPRPRASALAAAALFAPWPVPASAAVQGIPRHALGSLSLEEFYQQGPQSDAPLIFTDVPPEEHPCFGEHQADPDWLLEALHQHCGSTIRLDEMADPSVRGGKRAFFAMDFKRFVRLWRGREGLAPEIGLRGPTLGLEYPLLDRCARELWEQIRIPAYFSGDAGLRAKAAGLQFGENPGYPAITFSEAGFLTRSHVDMPNNEIWIAMCFGRKRVRSISMSEVTKHWNQGAHLERFASGKALRGQPLLLNLHLHDSIDLFDEAFVARELSGVEIYEGAIADGDILYMPTSAVHCVRTEQRTVYLISNFVDLNGLLAPHPGQLAVKLDSCAQRCHLANFTLDYGGPSLCRKAPYCNDLVAWLLDETFRFPLLDGNGIITNSSLRPQGSPSVWQVALAGADRLLRRPGGKQKPSWKAPWQGR